MTRTLAIAWLLIGLMWIAAAAGSDVVVLATLGFVACIAVGYDLGRESRP